MLRTARSLPIKGLLTLGSDPTRFQTEPPACYRASWQLPGPDSHRQATTSLRTLVTYIRSPPVPLGARKIEASRKCHCEQPVQVGEMACYVRYIHRWTGRFLFAVASIRRTN